MVTPISKTDFIIGALAAILLSNVNSYADDSYSFTSDIVMQAVPVDSGAFFEAELANTGDESDIYTVIKLNDIPASWFSVFCIDSLCLLDSGQVALDPGGTSSIQPDIFPQLSPGDGQVIIRVTSANNPDDVKEIAFRAVSGYQTLVINHGLAEDQYRSYYEDALSSSGIGFNYWDENFSAYRYSDLINFEKLVIYSGDRIGGIFTVEEIEALEDFLDLGANIFLSGQGLASSLDGSGFLENVLATSFVETYSGIMDIDGIDGDPIGGGLHFSIAGGDGANNQIEPDVILPVGEAVAIFSYASGPVSAIRSEGNGYKAVFFAFGLEAVDTGEFREAIMFRTFEWFEQTTSIESDYSPDLPSEFLKLTNYPNPFNAQTRITVNFQARRFETPNAVVEIFDVLGRQIAELGYDGLGRSAYWDGRNSQGLPVASGVYYYRLSSLGFRSGFSKMLLIR